MECGWCTLTWALKPEWILHFKCHFCRSLMEHYPFVDHFQTLKAQKIIKHCKVQWFIVCLLSITIETMDYFNVNCSSHVMQKFRLPLCHVALDKEAKIWEMWRSPPTSIAHPFLALPSLPCSSHSMTQCCWSFSIMWLYQSLTKKGIYTQLLYQQYTALVGGGEVVFFEQTYSM